jgi:hypothetical protein
MDIAINYKGKLYLVDREPFETFEETYGRGWFIIKNEKQISSQEELISLSIINNNLKKQMEYTIT